MTTAPIEIAPEKPREPRIFFRFDDIGPAHRKSFAFIQLMDSLERPYILAVIPDALSWWTKRLLRKNRHAIVFQHGRDHKSRSGKATPDELPDELGYQAIASKIRDGRKSLEDALGRPVAGYVPPWNRVSEVALRVLEDQGFRALSADSFFSTSLRQIPVSIDVYSAYRPVTVRSNASIETQMGEQMRRNELTGIVLHPASVPRDRVSQLHTLLAGNISKSVGAAELSKTFA